MWKCCKKCTKAEFIAIATHFHLNIQVGMKKAIIRQMVLDELVKQGLIPPIEKTDPVSPAMKAEEESPDEQKQTTTSRVKTEDTDALPTGNEAYLFRKMELEYALKQKELDAKMQRDKLEMELRLKQLDLEKQQQKSRTSSMDVSRNIRLVPPFKEDKVDKYFIQFEKVAKSLDWPKRMWPTLLQSVLIGKAQTTYASLSVEQCEDYEVVKKAILQAYELVPEAYRQKFRNYKKFDSQSHVEFANEKEMLFDRWCSSKSVANDFNKLRQLILLEEFKRSLNVDIRTHLEEQKPESLRTAAILADEYSLAHRGVFKRHTSQTKKSDKSDTSTSGASGSSEKSESKSNDNVQCKYCKKKDHTIDKCPILERKKTKQSPSGLVSSKDRNLHLAHVQDTVLSRDEHVEPMKEFEPFISEGFVSCIGGNEAYPVKILRDTGASQSLILESALPLPQSTQKGSVTLQGVELGCIQVPLHLIQLKSNIVNGSVLVGVRPSLPFEGISFLLGNDWAKEKVLPSPDLVVEPVENVETELLETEFPGIFPSCVVTRAMASKQSDKLDSHQLSDTFLCDIFGGYEGQNNSTSGAALQKTTLSKITKDQLIAWQEKDPEVSELSKQALSEEEAADVPVCFFKQSGVLMRKWRPLDTPAEHDWQVQYQIVAPPDIRSSILSLAHESGLAGHLGVN